MAVSAAALDEVHEALPRLRQALLLEGGGLGVEQKDSANLDLTKRGKIKSLLVRGMKCPHTLPAEDRVLRVFLSNEY